MPFVAEMQVVKLHINIYIKEVKRQPQSYEEGQMIKNGHCGDNIQQLSFRVTAHHDREVFDLTS